MLSAAFMARYREKLDTSEELTTPDLRESVYAVCETALFKTKGVDVQTGEGRLEILLAFMTQIGELFTKRNLAYVPDFFEEDEEMAALQKEHHELTEQGYAYAAANLFLCTINEEGFDGPKPPAASPRP